MASGGRRRKQSRRPKAKRTRYLSLSRLIIKTEEVATPSSPPPSPAAEPFAMLHHEASTLFDALPAPSLSDILGIAEDESPSRSAASPDEGFPGAQDELEEDLARRALRGRERWVYCCCSSSNSTTSSPTTTTTTTTTTATTTTTSSSSSPRSSAASTGASARPSLLLKLDYQEILAAWADRGSLYIAHAAAPTEPHPELDNVLVEPPRPHTPAARCGRAESVRRYREKRRNRLFAHRVRYEVRRVNAVRRPRCKGRFIKEHEEMETRPT